MNTLSSPLWVAIPLVVIVLAVAILYVVLVRVLGKKAEPVKNIESTMAMSTVETPAKTTSLQLTLFLVMATTLILGIWVRFIGVGWFLLFFFLRNKIFTRPLRSPSGDSFHANS